MKAKDLPIYQVTFELMKEITQVTRHFPRDLKISLGERLRRQLAIDTGARFGPHLTKVIVRKRRAA